jgi:transcription-repair coupling factor (superfamily II helicase)
MSLSGLLRVINDDPELKRALDEADSPASPGGDLIAPPALRPFLVAALAGAGGAAVQRRFVLAVTATAREAEDLTAALGSLLPEGAAVYFPPW